MIEKIWVPQSGDIYEDRHVMDGFDKINELVGEVNRHEKNIQNILDLIIKQAETLHRLLDKLGFPAEKEKADD